MELYFDNLVFFIDRYVRDTAAAEDIAIDAFSELIVHPSKYNFKTSLKTYLFMMGRSRALNLLKKRSRHPSAELSEAEQTADRLSLEERVISDESRRAVADAMESLPPDQKAVIHLVYFEQMSYEETARILKKNKKQIDNLLYRAKNALRTILGKECVL